MVLANDLGFITDEQIFDVRDQLDKTAKFIAGLVKN